MSYEPKRAPDQPAANDPKYVVIELRARIAELEAEVRKWKADFRAMETCAMAERERMWNDLRKYMEAIGRMKLPLDMMDGLDADLRARAEEAKP
jgi:uncharacterized small protein (DUF1192 family)